MTEEARKEPPASKNGKRARFDIQLDRHEAKYVIPRGLVAEIREFIRPFCEPDPHCSGDPPEYVITTLQLDSPTMALHYAKENEAVNRFNCGFGHTGIPSATHPSSRRSSARSVARSSSRARWCPSTRGTGDSS